MPDAAGPPPRFRVGRVLRRLFALLGAVIVLALTLGIVPRLVIVRQRATGARRTRMAGSPQWREDHFVNPQPIVNDTRAMLSGLFHPSPFTSPQGPVPVATGGGARFATPPASGLRVTWFGHSTMLVEIDGQRMLTDPVWSERASPLPGVGPRALVPAAARARGPAADRRGGDLARPLRPPRPSHDHRAEERSRARLEHDVHRAARDRRAPRVLGRARGAHRRARLVAARARGDLEIVCTPARHASGRMLVDNDAKLWSGWALLGPRHRVYYSGDTGLFPAMREIGERLGPFDLTMIEIGPVRPRLARLAHRPGAGGRRARLVRGKVMLPVHWGKFVLAYHGWTEPIERALAAARARRRDDPVAEAGRERRARGRPARERWWPALPLQTAAEDPIVSSQNGGKREMKAILFGATGMVGQGVLRECLLDAGRPSRCWRSAARRRGRSHAKLRELVHRDFTDFSGIAAELAGYDATFFCLGVSSLGMKEADYRRVTYDFTIAAARVLAEQNPG